MKARFIYLLLLLCLVPLVSGCNDDSLVDENVKTVDSRTKQIYYSQQFLNLMKDCITDVEFREFIKTEALEQFDGDYDILLAASLDHTFTTSLRSTNNVTLRDFFLTQLEGKGLRSTNANYSIIDSILLYCPLIQISVPELFSGSTDSWNPQTDSVLICLLPSDYDDQTTRSIEAFDINGNEYELSMAEAPKIPVIVIGDNERVEISNGGSLRSYSNSSFYKNSYYSYQFKSDNCDQTEKADISLLRSVSTVDRDTKTGSDILYKAKFNSITAFQQVEGWPNGTPELKVIIVYSEKVGSNYTSNQLIKLISKNGWAKNYFFWYEIATKTINVPIMTWNKDIYGLSMKYRWIEMDAGGSTTTTTSYANSYIDGSTVQVSTTETIGTQDDEAGEAIVQYNDPTSNGNLLYYNTGLLGFNIIQ